MPGHDSRCLQTVVVTVVAPLLFAEHYILQKRFHVIAFLIDYRQVLLLSIVPQGVLASKTFLVRMYVAVVEEAPDLKAFCSEDAQGVRGAWCAAYVKQDFDADISLCVRPETFEKRPLSPN
jgi:hypothetical protein